MKLDSLSKYVESLQQKGRYSFTRSEALKAMDITDIALKLSLHRLITKKRIASIKRGFYVTIPLEYSASGMLPPDWFIDDLMDYLDEPYYIGLLSAAAIHGVAHQQPQELQVIVPIHIRGVKSGRLRIRFIKKKEKQRASIVQAKTATGNMNVSDAALTALDLVGYAKQVGGLETVQPIIKELCEKITAPLLMAAAQSEVNLAFVQRLGFILDKLERKDLSGELSNWIERKKPKWTPLEPSSPRKGKPRNDRWHVIENIVFESEP
jgi:predicted transcriptional regulator of viral defense system